uniref:Uncharacterized protein n=1 Tax=Sphaerodactylus townsendi TaxID=933632 RepID=A0ACB8EI57_9SAUR
MFWGKDIIALMRVANNLNLWDVMDLEFVVRSGELFSQEFPTKNKTDVPVAHPGNPPSEVDLDEIHIPGSQLQGEASSVADKKLVGQLDPSVRITYARTRKKHVAIIGDLAKHMEQQTQGASGSQEEAC